MRTKVFSMALTLGALCIITHQSPAFATTYYVAPNGSGTACTIGNPCGLNSSRLLRTRELRAANHSRPARREVSWLPGHGVDVAVSACRLPLAPRRESGDEPQAPLHPGYSGGTAPDFDRLP